MSNLRLVQEGAPTIDERYEAWRTTQAGKQAYELFVHYTRRFADGQHSLSARDMFGYIRGDLADNGWTPGVEYRVNNSFAALLSRETMTTHPELAGVFRTKKRRAA